MTIGQRVKIRDGSIGHVEAIEDGWVDVRVLTPKNEPSCCVTVCPIKNLTPVGDNVIPMPRNAEWWAESRAFCEAVGAIVEEEF